MKRSTIRDMTVTALMAAVLCITAPFTLPIGAIPLSLASFVVYLTAALLGAKRGCAGILVYLLVGAVGLPVFSGFTGGIGVLAGPTGGFLVGYLFCTGIIGLMTDRWGEKRWVYPLSMVAGTLVLYAVGTVWFMVQSGHTAGAAMGLCVTPFLMGDGVKILCCVAVAYPLKKLLKKHGMI